MCSIWVSISVLSLDFLLCGFQFQDTFVFHLSFRIPSYIEDRSFGLFTEVDLYLYLAAIFLLMRYDSCVFGCFDHYDSFRLGWEALHDFSEVTEPEKVQFLIFHKVILDSFLQILNFAGQLMLLFLE